MPKKTYTIDKFEGGLNNYFDQRDIPENSAFSIENVNIFIPGKIFPLSPPLTYNYLTGYKFGEILFSSDSSTGIYKFSSDFTIDDRRNALGIVNNNSSITGSVILQFDLMHSFGIGDTVKINGLKDEDGALGTKSGRDNYYVVSKVIDHRTILIINEDVENVEATALLANGAEGTANDITTFAINDADNVTATDTLISIDTIEDSADANFDSITNAWLGKIIELPVAGTAASSGGTNYARVDAIDSTNSNLTVTRAIAGGSAQASNNNAVGHIFSSERVSRMTVQKIARYKKSQESFIAISNDNYVSVLTPESLHRNVVNLGTKTSQNNHSFYSYEGGLRVCESNFEVPESFDNVNTNKIYRYFKPEAYWWSKSVGTQIPPATDFRDNITGSTHWTKTTPAVGASTITSTGATFSVSSTTATVGNIISPTNSGDHMTVTDRNKYTIIFNLALNSSNIKYGKERMPSLYIQNTHGSNAKQPNESTRGDIVSDIYECYEGLNVHVIEVFDIDVNADVFPTFYHYGKIDYTITNFTVLDGIWGTPKGWQSLDQEITTPVAANFDVTENATTTATPDTADEIYIAIDESSNAGTWMFNSETKHITLGMSWLYDDIEYPQEGRIFNGDAGGDISGGGTPNDGKALAGQVRIYKNWSNPRIVGARVYIVAFSNSTSQGDMLSDPLLLFTIRRDGVEYHDGTHKGWEANSSEVFVKVDFDIKDFPILTFSSMGNYDPYTSSITHRWKASAKIGAQMFIGNVRTKDDNNNWTTHGDRLLYSVPGMADVFPNENRLDIAYNDGSEIVALESFNDRLLQFKQNALYILYIPPEIGGQGLQLESVHEGISINTINHVTKMANGIAWINSKGCYIYNGQGILDIVEGYINRAYWANIITDSHKIGYCSIDNSLMIMDHPSLVYSLTTKSWTRMPSLKIPSSNLLDIYHRGLFFVSNPENTIEVGGDLYTTTTPVLGRKASGTYSWSGTTGTFKKGMYFNNSSDASKRMAAYVDIASTDSLELQSQKMITAINSYSGGTNTDTEGAHDITFTASRNLNTPQTNTQIDQDLEESYNSDNNSIASVTIVADQFGIYPNSASTAGDPAGSESIFFGNGVDDDGSDDDFIDNPSSGSTASLSSAKIGAMSGGVNPVAGVHKFNIDRRDNTSSGTIYRLTLYVMNHDGSIPASNGIVLNYTTSVGDTSSNVATGLKDLINESEISHTMVATTSSGTLILTMQLEDSQDPISSNIYTSGYYRLSEDNFLTKLDVLNAAGANYRLHAFKPITPMASDDLFHSDFTYFTKDITFEDAYIKKTIYKIYITYRSSGSSGVTIFGRTNKTTSDKTFKEGTNYAQPTNLNGKVLSDTSNAWATAILEPSTASEFKGIYSLALRFGAIGDVPSKFYIGTISIVYRMHRGAR